MTVKKLTLHEKKLELESLFSLAISMQYYDWVADQNEPLDYLI